MNKCLVCGKPIEAFMSFGKMPIANGFLTKENFKSEYYFDMDVATCTNCNMFQLINQPDREQMFNENYAFFSGTSTLMATHFEKFADRIIDEFVDPDPFVAEIGSNDGIMLQNFAKKNIRHIGFEPSQNVANVARQKGINTIVEFFDLNLAKKIVAEDGKVDAFIGANVMCHIPYIKSVVEGIKELVKINGIVAFEDPYLGDVIKNTTYDQIYDEHTFLFSVHSVKYLFGLFDMEIIDVEPQVTHGGSMRYIIAHRGQKEISERVELFMQKERTLGLELPETYQKFKANCEKSRKDLVSILNEKRQEGKRVVGYAATSKSTTIINYCGITREHLSNIYDTTPIKQNKYSPGAHIPITPHEKFADEFPDYALLFGYNHLKEIMEKEKKFKNEGGKWITYVPEVKIL